MNKLYTVPVVCMTDGCARNGSLVNIIRGISEEQLDEFFEGYTDDCSDDYCFSCGELAIACDPVEEALLSRIHSPAAWAAIRAMSTMPENRGLS